MADSILANLSAASALTGDDLIYAVDDPSGTPADKYVTAAIARNFMNMVYAAYSTDAGFTPAVNTIYGVDISGFGAARTATLPGTAAVGDQVGLFITTTHATVGRELLVTGAGGQGVIGFSGGSVAGGSEATRIYQVGEFLLFRCVVANTTWLLVADGRIPQKGTMGITTSGTTNTADTLTRPVSDSSTGAAWTSIVQVGCLNSTTADKSTVRRGGYFNMQARYVAVGAASAASKICTVRLTNDAAGILLSKSQYAVSSSDVMSIDCSRQGVAIVAGDSMTYKFAHEDANKGIVSGTSPFYNSGFSFVEVLK